MIGLVVEAAQDAVVRQRLQDTRHRWYREPAFGADPVSELGPVRATIRRMRTALSMT